MPGTQKRLDYPPEFAGELQRLGDESVASLEDEPDAAKAKAFEQLDLVEQAEAAAGHPLHKGQPLFNVAVAESVRSLEGARGWFVAAYIEDARLQSSAPFDTPAATMLTVVYRYTVAELQRVAEWAGKNPADDPAHLGMLIAARDTSDPLELPFPEHSSDEDLDALDRGDLVFVGGSYRYEWPNIVAIAWGVRQAGFIPVVVTTFPDLPGEKNRRKSFRLLDRCASAMIDGSGVIAPGWVNEIEHIARDPIPTAIAYAEDRPDRDPNFSSMLPGEDEIPGLRHLPFTNHDQLTADVARWLAENVSRPARRVSPADPDALVVSVTASGIRLANGSNTRYLPGLPAPGSAYLDERYAVGSGGDYSVPEDPVIGAMRNAEMWAERLRQGKRGMRGPIVVRGDGSVFEVGAEVQPELGEDSSEPGDQPSPGNADHAGGPLGNSEG